MPRSYPITGGKSGGKNHGNRNNFSKHGRLERWDRLGVWSQSVGESVKLILQSGRPYGTDTPRQRRGHARVRAAIQRSKAPLKELNARHGLIRRRSPTGLSGPSYIMRGWARKRRDRPCLQPRKRLWSTLFESTPCCPWTTAYTPCRRRAPSAIRRSGAISPRNSQSGYASDTTWPAARKGASCQGERVRK